ncbi:MULTISPECIES: GH39 family glycosyl hydrolase [Pseudomonas]|uniref:GH39 family glycosyl hydrolase n=1 Tax=Pseudomonas TaxID=286 RepID=UPI000CF6AB8F|nr:MULTISPECIES: cellulase family glycosylhydrolase [Pseudomonas]AVJ37581.1 beta-xylosidase [Pseudomonas lurida]PRA11456.1 beta-xylosidase [Pseudomonas sp. MYb13]PRA18217.1 beta-xylosidase [Pseudomonas lurida]PRA34549.1 beta-xylosidase [Pseudomonas lurida]PRB94136.1 beta-xylosidase [Pseudomonas lurida]
MARKPTFLATLAVVVALGLTAFLWGRQADAESHVLKGSKEVVWKDFLGVNAQFLWFSPERYQKQIDRLKALGLEWVRLDLHWDQLETAQNQYKLATLDELVGKLQQNQIKSVFYLVGSARFISSAPPLSMYPDQYPPKDPNVFANRMALLSQRYPSVDAWQVWNEPNLLGFWRPAADPAGYATLLTATTQALRAVNPSKPVVAAGMAFFSEMPNGQTMFDALGALGVASLNTVVSYHPYTQLPEGNDPANLDFIAKTTQLNQALRNGGVQTLWSTEWGWSTYKGPKDAQDIITPQAQADYVVRRLALMSAMDFDKIFLFTLSDLDQRASVRDQSYGLLDIDTNPKAVYTALKNFLDVSGPKLTPADPPTADALPDGLFSIGWTRTDGRKLWFFWSAQGGNAHLPNLAGATLYDPLRGTQTPVSGTDGLTVPVKSNLQILLWD